jgi:hypothetical protein
MFQSFILIFCLSNPMTATRYTTHLDGSIHQEQIITEYDITGRTPPQQMPGWPNTMGTHPNYKPSGVSLADIDNNGTLEIIAGSTDNTVHVWDYLGNELSGWPITLPAIVQSKVAIGDIDNNGDMEIIIAARDGYVYVHHHDGTSFTGWPQNANGVLGLVAPTLFDLDHDGDLEIIMPQMQSGQPGHVYVWHHDGQVYTGWPQNTDYLAVATPAVADIDNDSLYEIVVLSYRSVYVWDQNGNIKPGWPRLNVAGGMSYAQPVLADLDDDGDLEVLHSYYTSGQSYVGIYHHDGTNFTSWPQTYPGPQAYTTPVTADIDNDDDLEIFGGGHSNSLGARHHNGTQVSGWPVLVNMLECSPIVFDLDNDGDREVLIGDNLSPGSFYAYHGDGSVVTDWPIPTTAATMVNSAAVGDVDLDGDIEIALVVLDGTVNLWTLDSIPYHGYLTDWGTFFHDIWNTGWLHPAPPQNLGAVVGADYITLLWSANSEPDIAGYNAYRADVSGGPYVKVNTVLITDTTYTDTTVIPGNGYYYCVTAQIKALAESRLSNETFAYVGVQEYQSNQLSGISATPNPFTKYLLLNIPEGQSAQIHIYDVKGSLIHEIEGIGPLSWKPERTLPEGVYFVFIKAANNVAVNKIIKLH